MVIIDFFLWQKFCHFAKGKNPNNHRQGRKSWENFQKNCHTFEEEEL